MKSFRTLLAFLVILISPAACVFSQQRPPATPLITHDPYFSVWSTSNNLAESDTVHWTLSPQPINGVIRIDGKPYRFMGKGPNSRTQVIPAMEQISSAVTPTHTRYQFRRDGVELEFTFF